MINTRALLSSLGYAFEGVRYAFIHNQNLRVHFYAACLVILASIILHVTTFEKSILGVMILLVFSAEMINTALEQMTDLIKKEHNAEAKIAKDVAAGMVLLISIGSVIVGILIFLPYIEQYFGR